MRAPARDARQFLHDQMPAEGLQVCKLLLVMIQDSEIRARLHGAVDRVGLGPDRERVARYVVGLLVPEVSKLLREALREERSKNAKFHGSD
jgi:hypothetical protein